MDVQNYHPSFASLVELRGLSLVQARRKANQINCHCILQIMFENLQGSDHLCSCLYCHLHLYSSWHHLCLHEVHSGVDWLVMEKEADRKEAIQLVAEGRQQ